MAGMVHQMSPLRGHDKTKLEKPEMENIKEKGNCTLCSHGIWKDEVEGLQALAQLRQFSSLARSCLKIVKNKVKRAGRRARNGSRAVRPSDTDVAGLAAVKK